MKRLVFHFFALALLSIAWCSCKQEVVEPGQEITGRYALGFGTALTNSYIEFDRGGLYFYESGGLYPLAEKTIWHTDGDDFNLSASGPYRIEDGVLYFEEWGAKAFSVLGKIRLDGDKLCIGESIYSVLNGFDKKPYSVIRPAKDELVLTYAAEDVLCPVSIDNPIPDQHFTANTSAEWIHDLRAEEGTLYFKTTATNKNRSAIIYLNYVHADTYSLKVTQAPSTFIRISEPSGSVGYEASSQTLPYSIENPIPGSQLQVSCGATWVENIQVKDSEVAFSVLENNTGQPRSTKFLLTYEGAADVEFALEQKWASSAIVCTPAAGESEYSGGPAEFTFEVQNPRLGVSVLAESQTYWITDVVISGNKVTYKVAENNSGAQRSGKIKLTYSSFATAEFVVTQKGKPVVSLTLNKTNLSLHPGNSESLIATVDPEDANLTWTSNNQSAATVDQSGKVTAVGNGIATINVSAENGKSASCVVMVTTLVASISLDNASIVLNEGQEQTLIPTVTPATASDKSLSWTSSNESAAIVDNNGKVTAISKGTTTIKAMANDGSGKYATCSVTVKRPVTYIQLNKTSLVLYRGTSDITETLTATVIPSDANNTAVTWSSSNTSVAMVSNFGVVTGKYKGTATIMVTANDGNGAQATCEVEVKQYVTSISLDNSSLTLTVGGEATLSVTTILPENANDKSYTWSSSDSDIASVDNGGKVTAKSKGNTTIKATANDGSGVFASCSVKVKNPPPAGAVDLGLSVYWATSNLSTSGLCANPQDYGDYYAWGETDSKRSSYVWKYYKWCNGSAQSLTRYCPSEKTNYWGGSGSPDNKTSFKDYDYADDAAREKLGGSWRTPTDAEWTELRENCTWTTTFNYNGTGIAGGIVKSKKPGYTSKSIFLPAAGYRDLNDLSSAGSNCFYWSSSLNTDNPDNAWYIYFYSGTVSKGRHNLYRYLGFSVRPVSE